jgi:hypothetical protein
MTLLHTIRADPKERALYEAYCKQLSIEQTIKDDMAELRAEAEEERALRAQAEAALAEERARAELALAAEQARAAAEQARAEHALAAEQARAEQALAAEQARAERALAEAELLRAKLRALGLDPDALG